MASLPSSHLALPFTAAGKIQTYGIFKLRSWMSNVQRSSLPCGFASVPHLSRPRRARPRLTPHHLRGLDMAWLWKSNPHRESGTRSRAAADVGQAGKHEGAPHGRLMGRFGDRLGDSVGQDPSQSVRKWREPCNLAWGPRRFEWAIVPLPMFAMRRWIVQQGWRRFLAW